MFHREEKKKEREQRAKKSKPFQTDEKDISSDLVFNQFSFIFSHHTWFMHLAQVGAPPEVVARLEEACASAVAMAGDTAGSACLGEDPSLDQFMEAYCEMLTKYEQELSKPLKEAMLFLQRIECQFKNLTISSSDLGDDPFLSLLTC